MKNYKNNWEIRPLSFIKYLQNNTGKSLAMIIALVLSIFLILIAQMIFYSVVEGPRLGATITDSSTIVYPGDKGNVDAGFRQEIEKSTLVEKVVCMYEMNTDYYHFFGAANMKLYFTGYKDMKYIIDKLGLKLKEGKMPEAGKDEVLLDWRLANNKGKRLGDFIGKGVDPQEKISGKYKIVGLSDGGCIIGICPVAESQIHSDEQMIVFPKTGQLEELNAWFDKVPSEKAFLWNKMKADDNYQESVETIDKLSGFAYIGIIFVMSFAAGNSCYAQYFSRRYEFGILQSLGYTRAQILLRAAKEIFMINLVGFIGGVLLSFAVGLTLYKVFFIPHGYPFVLVEFDGLLKTITIPVCTALFSLIPSGWLLSKIDTMIVIEKFE